MRKLLVLVQIVVLASVALAGEEAVEEKAEIRRRLVEAFNSQTVCHHALRWRVKRSEGGNLGIFTEYFQEGERAGIRATVQEGDGAPQDHFLMVTDGDTVQAVQDGHAFSLEGIRPLNEHLAPYTAACRRLAARWDRPIPYCTYRLTPWLHVTETADGPMLLYSLALEPGGPGAGWLTAEYFEDLEVSLLPEEGQVRVRSEHFEGRLRLADGLPVSWSGHNPRTGGSLAAEESATAWGRAKWHAEIERLCEGKDPEEAALRGSRVQGMGLGVLLRDVTEAVPDLLDSMSRVDDLIRAAVEADLVHRGPASLAEDAGEEERSAHASRGAAELGEAFRKMAEKAGWSGMGAKSLGARAEKAWRDAFAKASAR